MMAAMEQLLWALVLLVNVAAVVAFGFDKLQSKRQKARRIPERVLLWLMFFGGLLGGWFAMSFFRHKTIKRSFRVKAVLVTLLSPVWLLVYWWFKGGGEA